MNMWSIPQIATGGRGNPPFWGFEAPLRHHANSERHRDLAGGAFAFAPLPERETGAPRLLPSIRGDDDVRIQGRRGIQPLCKPEEILGVVPPLRPAAFHQFPDRLPHLAGVIETVNRIVLHAHPHRSTGIPRVTTRRGYPRNRPGSSGPATA